MVTVHCTIKLESSIAVLQLYFYSRYDFSHKTYSDLTKPLLHVIFCQQVCKNVVVHSFC